MSELDFSTTQATGELTAEGLTEALEILLYDHEETDVPPPIGSWFAGMKDTIISLNMAIGGYDGPNVVEGSIIQSITDEGRLLK